MIALERLRSGDLGVERKDDGSPVTAVDREIERAQRALLADRRPGDAITGEELGAGGAGARWRWYLDPIDGTSDYIAGGKLWKILIALADRGEIVLAAVSAPAIGSRWWAVRGHGAYRDGIRLHVSRTARLAEATISDDWRHTLTGGEHDESHPLVRLAGRCARIAPYRGHSFLAVAAGEIDIALSTLGFEWDYAPMKLIVEEAGGRFTDLQGRAAIDSRNAVVSNGALHDELLAVIDRGEGESTRART